MSLTIRERVLAAFAAQLAANVGAPATVERNCEAPAELEAIGVERVIVIDGDQEPADEPAGMGQRQYVLAVDVEGYVRTRRPNEVGPAINALHGRVLKAAFLDRTLGGLAVDVVDAGFWVDVFRGDGASPGAGFGQTFAIGFRTSVDDPTVLA